MRRAARTPAQGLRARGVLGSMRVYGLDRNRWGWDDEFGTWWLGGRRTFDVMMDEMR